MSHAERVYLQKADHVLAVSQPDRDFFASFLPADKLTVISTGVDIDYFQPSTELEESNTLVFTGSMDWLPNEDGICFFVEQILPHIREVIPTVKLNVVGRKPSRQLLDLAVDNPAVTLTGWVEDIRPHLAKGAVCVVPLRIGSGTRLKIFEAMAMGKAVVSTTIGAEGLPAHHGKHLLLADSPADFARCVIELLRNGNSRRDLGVAARRLVESQYSWAAVTKDFAGALSGVLAKHKPTPEASFAR